MASTARALVIVTDVMLTGWLTSGPKQPQLILKSRTNAEVCTPTKQSSNSDDSHHVGCGQAPLSRHAASISSRNGITEAITAPTGALVNSYWYTVERK